MHMEIYSHKKSHILTRLFSYFPNHKVSNLSFQRDIQEGKRQDFEYEIYLWTNYDHGYKQGNKASNV